MDEAGFRALFAAQFDDVWRFARRRTSSAADADDVTAETFAVAWRRRGDLPPDDEARLWLFGTARHVLANHRRGDRRRSGLGARLSVVPAPPGPGDPGVVAVDHDQDARALWSALASLSADDRDLLIMRAWDDLAVTDMATLLDCSPNAVSVRLTKARRRLADALDAGSTDEGTDPTRSRTSDGRTPNPGGGPR